MRASSNNQPCELQRLWDQRCAAQAVIDRLEKVVDQAIDTAGNVEAAETAFNAAVQQWCAIQDEIYDAPVCGLGDIRIKLAVLISEAKDHDMQQRFVDVLKQIVAFIDQGNGAAPC